MDPVTFLDGRLRDADSEDFAGAKSDGPRAGAAHRVLGPEHGRVPLVAAGVRQPLAARSRATNQR